MRLHYRQTSLSQRLATQLWRCKWVLMCLAISAYFFAASGYIHAKAVVAQMLIENAWQVSMQSGEQVSPWAWADTYPVASISIDQETLYVLAGANGRSMAFAPGHMSHTPLPGEQGNAVISGHRDTHFAILEHLQIGDVISTTTLSKRSEYEVIDIRIAHHSQVELTESGADDLLTLITCYPFNSLNPDPPLRFIVRALKAERG